VSVRLALLVVLACASSRVAAQTPAAVPGAPRSGAEVYRAGCVSCHGPTGEGQPRSTVGFTVELPDFADCVTATAERNADWRDTVLNGGKARAFDRKMPSFKDFLTSREVDNVVDYLRGFCRDRRWPQGDLNLPRPLVTEKAFPENETVITSSYERPGGGAASSSSFIYEHRIGARSQYELNVPLSLQHASGGSWSRGLGDAAVAFKRVLFYNVAAGSILSAGAEAIFPTGKESEGLGGGVTVLEPFAVFSQQLPSDGFLHVHGGFERPLNHDVANDVSYLRMAIGRTFVQPNNGRNWSPMVELLSERELTTGARVLFDVVPQMQVTLSRRRHIMVSAGLQMPLNERSGRNRKALVYFLWDWFDGGLFEGW
jgi:mono/diheme cytochrome c family protein